MKSDAFFGAAFFIAHFQLHNVVGILKETENEFIKFQSFIIFYQAARVKIFKAAL